MMPQCVLVIYPDDLGPRVLEGVGPAPTGEDLAGTVRAFLQDRQPLVSQRVEIIPRTGSIQVASRLPLGEGTLDLLRAVEGILGMADKLPEVADEADLPELDADGVSLDLPPPLCEEEPPDEEVLLRSKVRHFPLPEAEWFEICEGHILLTRERIAFEPRYRPFLEDPHASRRHEIRLRDVRGVGRDCWLHIPCLRVEKANASYRYGWPGRRDDVHSTFDVDEWLAALETLTGRARDHAK